MGFHRFTILILLQAVGLVVAQSWEWKQGRATYYGQDSTIHQGSCGYGQICPNQGTGWDVASIADRHWAYSNSCGRCYEVMCRSATFTDAFGETIERENVCYEDGASVVVTIIDSCPCDEEHYSSYSNQRWCCGDMEHLGLSIYAFEKLTSTDYGVIGITYREVPCDYQPQKQAQVIDNPSKANYDFDSKHCVKNNIIPKQNSQNEQQQIEELDNKYRIEQYERQIALQNIDEKLELKLNATFVLNGSQIQSQHSQTQFGIDQPQNFVNNMSTSMHQSDSYSQNFPSIQDHYFSPFFDTNSTHSSDNMFDNYLQTLIPHIDNNVKQSDDSGEELIVPSHDSSLISYPYQKASDSQPDTHSIQQLAIVSSFNSSLTQNQSIYDGFDSSHNWWLVSSKAYVQRMQGQGIKGGITLCGEIQPGGVIEFIGQEGAFYGQSKLQLWIKNREIDGEIPDLDLNIGQLAAMCSPFRILDIKPAQFENGFGQLDINLGIFDVPRTNTQNYQFKECNGQLASTMNTLQIMNSKLMSQSFCFDSIKLLSTM